MTHPIFSISRSALDVEWQRVEVIAANLANLNTTRTADGLPYSARVLVSGPRFSAMLSGSAAVNQEMQNRFEKGVRVLGLEETKAPPKRVYDPAHPHADASGFVSFPNIDHVREMTTMIAATRVYEANLASFTNARSMFMRAIEIGAR